MLGCFVNSLDDPYHEPLPWFMILHALLGLFHLKMALQKFCARNSYMMSLHMLMSDSA